MSKSIQKFPREANVPKNLNGDLIGSLVLYRIPGQVVFKEGIIQEFTEPEKKYVRIGDRWMATKNHTVVAIRKSSKTHKKRSTPQL